MSRKAYTTSQAAKAAGVTRATLQAWIAGGLAAPEPQLRNGRAVRLWSASDVARLRQVKKENLSKRGRRPKKK
jgi:DNA-binding transcriptional MerR regulator